MKTDFQDTKKKEESRKNKTIQFSSDVISFYPVYDIFMEISRIFLSTFIIVWKWEKNNEKREALIDVWMMGILFSAQAPRAHEMCHGRDHSLHSLNSNYDF